MVIMYGCMECGLVSSRNKWLQHTAVKVLGPEWYMNDYNAIGEIAEPAIRKDLNYFWICPECDSQVHGNQITVENVSEEYGKVEEVGECVHPDDIEEDIPEAEIQVNLTIVLSVERKYTREEILGRIHDILLEGVDPATSVEAIFDQILIEGIDY